MTPRTISPIALAVAGIVAVVALWLLTGLASTPAALGLVLTFAGLPLLLVVLPALVVRTAGDDGRVQLRLRSPVAVSEEESVALTDGGHVADGETERDN